MLFSKIRDLYFRKKFVKAEYKIKINKFIFINLLSKLKNFKKAKKKKKKTFFL